MASEPLDEKAIFNVARRIQSPDGRTEYLQQVCGDDVVLLARVENLLSAYEQQASFLESSPGNGASPTIGTATAETLGTQIGPYKLLQLIGEGGMGTVFMAEQAEPIHRRVAVKVIKPGMDSRQVVARFEAERQALAMMDHVNIARVLDGGATPGGRPYFVMELVHGVPITQYCDENHLTPRERLELFVPVCYAIQHAHQKGIIHRDIKPSNVMITLYDGKPVPKVIDFGVAKAIEQKLTERTLFTQYGTMVGTLEYMSPEQAEMSALGVDTRSDVYSLGVLLYELLTGSTPLTSKRMKEVAYAEILRMIKEEDPPRPSTRLSDSGEALASISANRHMEPAKLTKVVRGELDWIVMRTLEKNRNRRYESASAFAADVQRYLNHEAVQACPPSAAYRFRKFTRRNKVPIAITALVLVIFALLTGGIGWNVRDRAALQGAIAQKVNLALAEAERLQEQQRWSESLEAAKRAEAVMANGGNTELRERVRRLRLDLEMVLRLDEIRARMGPKANGEWDFEGAVHAYAQAFAEYGIDVLTLPTEEAAALIRSRPGIAGALVNALDRWEIYDTDAGTGRKLARVAHAADTDPWRRQLRSARHERDGKQLAALAESTDLLRQPPTNLANLSHMLFFTGHDEAGLEVLRRAQRQYPGDFWLNHQLAIQLGEMKPPQIDEAVTFQRVAVALRPQNAAAHSTLGWNLSQQGKFDEAIACHMRAIEIDPNYAAAYNNLGVTLKNQGRFLDAIAAYQHAIQLDPAGANIYTNMGIVHERTGNLVEAVAWHKKAIEVDPQDLISHRNLGKALAAQGKDAEAAAVYQAALRLVPDDAETHYCLGNTHARRNEIHEAIACFRKSIEYDPTYTSAYGNLGVMLKKDGNLDEAVACYRRAIELEPNLAVNHDRLGTALYGQKKLDEAVVAYQTAIELDPQFASAYMGLGNALSMLNRLDEAVAAFRKVTELTPSDADAYFNLGVTLRKQKKLDEAIVALQNAIALDPQDAQAYRSVGRAWLEKKNVDEAIAAFRKSIELDPTDAQLHNSLGAILCESKHDYEEAAACFRKAIDLKPNVAHYRANLGRALRGQKEFDEAIAAFRKALELDPMDAQVHNSLGAILCDRKHDYEAAAACFRKAMEIQPQLAVAYFNLGNSLRHQMKPDQAIAEYRKANQLDPSNAASHYELAWLLSVCSDLKLRDPVQALSSAQRAVQLAPNNATYWQGLGYAEYRSGNWEAAIRALERVKELGSPGDSREWFPLAMAHWQLGDKETARTNYDQAVQWMELNEPQSELLRRLQAEAAQLLGIEPKKE